MKLHQLHKFKLSKIEVNNLFEVTTVISSNIFVSDCLCEFCVGN